MILQARRRVAVVVELSRWPVAAASEPSVHRFIEIIQWFDSTAELAEQSRGRAAMTDAGANALTKISEAWLSEEYVQVNGSQVRSAMESLTLVGDLVVTGGRFADIGCGTGEVARKMARRGLSVFACDASTSMVEATRRRCVGLAVQVEQQDANALRLPDGTFTIVHSSWVLHWVVRAADAVRSMARAVRPGGALVLQWSHSQPLAEGPGLVGVIRDVAARPIWRDRLAEAPFTQQQHPLAEVAEVVAGEGMEIVRLDTALWRPAAAPAGALNLAAVRRQVRLTGFAPQAAVLGDDVDRFIEECVAAVAATHQVDPRDSGLIARQPG